jgi:septum site-determining protein MinC
MVRDMTMEDTSEKHEAEAMGKLEKEERQSVQGYIAIKGTRNGLLLTLEPETPFSDLLTALSERLAEAPSFFRGASLALDTTRRSLQRGERTQLEALLSYYHMSVAAQETPTAAPPALASSPGAHENARKESGDLAEVNTSQATDPQAHNEQPALREADDTLFLRRTVRSGQAIHHASNVVVLGDVNPGGEIVAGGDIIVWGVLRGMVHAGYPDNEQALICSLLLAPVQLRIAHLLSRPPEGYEAQPRPEVAAIRDGQIVVEAWVNGRPPRK